MTARPRVGAAVLVADIGGSNARFALSRAAGSVGAVEIHKAALYESFPEALGVYLCGLRGDGRLGPDERLAGLHIAAAGPVGRDGIQLTNSPWTIRRDEIGRLVPDTPLYLYNDLEAVALALPHLGPLESVAIGRAMTDSDGEDRDSEAPRLAVNVGTGFGAAVARKIPGRGWLAFASEAGHMAFAARNAAELELAGGLQSVEDVLSGRGLADVCHRLGGAGARDAADVFAMAGTDTAADRAIAIFCDLLGRTAGDLVLAHGAWGGVYLCGSVACAWAKTADAERFRSAFEAKGLVSDRMARVATSRIVTSEPALQGLTQTAFET